MESRCNTPLAPVDYTALFLVLILYCLPKRLLGCLFKFCTFIIEMDQYKFKCTQFNLVLYNNLQQFFFFNIQGTEPTFK